MTTCQRVHGAWLTGMLSPDLSVSCHRWLPSWVWLAGGRHSKRPGKGSAHPAPLSSSALHGVRPLFPPTHQPSAENSHSAAGSRCLPPRVLVSPIPAGDCPYRAVSEPALSPQSLVREPLSRRRQLLRENFVETEGEFLFATSLDSKDLEQIAEFLEQSVKGEDT